MPEMELGMKRSAGDDNDDDMKRSRQDMSKVRLLVLGRYCGGLIGKGGENFKRLRESYSVRITGLNSRANERVLNIEGEDENCLQVIRELLPSCPDARYAASSGNDAMVLNLLANTDAVGMLIGKGGAKMKEIGSEAGCRLKIYPKCLPMSNERVVAIGGDTEDAIIKGATLALEILGKSKLRSPPVYFNPENVSNADVLAMDLANNSGGGGAGGFHGPPANNNGMMPQRPPQQVSNIQPPQGNPLDTNIAMMLIAQRELKQNNPVDPKIDFSSVPTSTTLTLSNEMCGAIIGKGGQNIKFTRNMSGAKIDFTKNAPSEDGSVSRTITITGTQEQVRIAEELMNQCVRGSENIIRNGGGNGNLQDHQQQQQQQQQQQPGMFKIQDSYRQLYDSL